MSFFKSLADGLNYEEFLLPDYRPAYFDAHIVSIRFYHNLIIIHKGVNKEDSPTISNRVFRRAFKGAVQIKSV